MRSQNRKVNNIGRTSCLGLLALGLALVNPVGLSAFAEEANEADVPAPQAEIPSTMSISFSPTSGSASISPTTSAGQSAQIKVLATVNVQKSGGYSVYVKSNSQNLVGVKDSNNIIPGMQGSATYANIPVNSWGYYATEGSVVPDNATYKAVSTTGNGDKVAENTSNKITSDTKTIALSFAAKINDEKPADIYQNTVTMSVVSSPVQLSLGDISEMQQMTSETCENTASNAMKQLRDTRDDKMYWVKKMPDGKCWMVQNLDLNLGSSWPDASKSDYDTPATAYTPIATQDKQETADVSQTNTRSWDFGEWVINEPSKSSSCGTGLNDLSTCTSQFTNVAGKTSSTNPTFYKDNNNKAVVGNEYDAHYLVGNYYSWNTATAGTGGGITTGEASGSICPKNWKLPTSNSTVAGSFGGLTATLTGANDAEKLTDLTGDGYFFVRGGIVYQDINNLFGYAGGSGHYWSSTPNSNDETAYDLYFGSTTNLFSSSVYARYNGTSVRCVAR